MNAQPQNMHATYAPSSAHRWTVCTASAEAIARLGEQEEGEEAAQGTAAHDEIERCMIGEPDDPSWLDVDADHPAAFGIALFLDYCRKLSHGTFWVEQRVRLTDQLRGMLTDTIPDGWVALHHASRTLGISRQTVLQKVKRGELRAVLTRTGRRKGLRIEIPTPQDSLF